MLPDEHPIMQHYDAEVVITDDALRPAPEELPVIDVEAIRDCNRHLRRAAEDAPELATVYAGYCFRKARQHCPDDWALLEETAGLLVELLLSHEGDTAIPTALLALASTEAGTPLERYEVYRRATASADVVADRDLRHHCSEQAVMLAEEVLREEPDRWQPLVEARLSMAGLLQTFGEPARAEDECQQAINVLQFRDLDREHADLHARSLHRLGLALLGQGELDGAWEALSDCETLLRDLMRGGGIESDGNGLCGVLLDQAEVLTRQDERHRARTKTQEAIELSRDASAMVRHLCHLKAPALLERAGYPRAGRDVLFELTGTEMMLAAGSAGFEDVAELAKLEAEDEGSFWVPQSRLEVKEGASLHQRRLRDAERLLNIDPELVAERISGLECALERIKSEHSGRGLASLRSLLQAWRALRIVREVALQVCCKRAVLPGGWGDGFPDEPQTFAGCEFTPYAQDTTMDSHPSSSAFRLIAEISVPPEPPVDPVPEDASSLADAMAVLRERLEVWRKGRDDRLDRRIGRWSFAFSGFRPQQIRLLQKLHRDAPLSRYEIGVPLHRAGMLIPSPGLDSQTVADIVYADEFMARAESRLTICKRNAAAAGDRLRRRTAQTLELIMDAVTDEGAPELRLCQAPTSPSAYLQWRLNERDDLSICGDFYFPKHAKKQGCSCNCSNVISKLRNSTEDLIWDQAEKIAERDFRKHGQPGDAFLSRWQDAKDSYPDDPASVLTAFRSAIGMEEA